MRVRDVSPAQQRVLHALAGRISMRLESTFKDSIDADGPNVGVVLRERGSTVSIEVPIELLQRAAEDFAARESLRMRLKAPRDRMLFRTPPAPLPRRIEPAGFVDAGGPRGFRRQSRGRR